MLAWCLHLLALKSKQLFPSHLSCCRFRNSLSEFGIPPLAAIMRLHWFSIVFFTWAHCLNRKLWRFSLFCTRFTRELQTVSYSLQGCKRHQVWFYLWIVSAGCMREGFGKRVFCCCFCFNGRWLCLRVYVETQPLIKTFLSHSLIWLQQLPDSFIHKNLSIHCWYVISSHV